jgi:hypothetical protein
MPNTSSRAYLHLILLLAAVAAVCLATSLWFGLQFEKASGGFRILDLAFGGYQAADALALRDQLIRPDQSAAAGILFRMYIGPDLVMPACFGILFALLLHKYAAGGRMYGKDVTPGVMRALLLLPLVYGLADYAENAFGLFYYFRAASAGEPEMSAKILPWLTATKFAFFFLNAILLVRFAIFRYWMPQDPDKRS